MLTCGGPSGLYLNLHLLKGLWAGTEPRRPVSDCPAREEALDSVAVSATISTRLLSQAHQVLTGDVIPCSKA